MYLVVGLGNPGVRYEGTRHNAGFMAVDLLARQNNIDVGRTRFGSLLGKGRIAGIECQLAKPQLFMNLSGEPVQRIADYFSIATDRILVLHDDLDVEVGRIKVAAGGGAGGHKGVASIMGALGYGDFARVKIGVGRPPREWTAESYVLSRFGEHELELIEKELHWAAEAAEVFVTNGVAAAQARFNRKDLNELGVRR